MLKADVNAWVNQCEEPEVELHFTLAHATIEGDPYPRPCPIDDCNAFHGTHAENIAEEEKENAEFDRLEAAAAKSDAGRDAFNTLAASRTRTGIGTSAGSGGGLLSPKSRRGSSSSSSSTRSRSMHASFKSSTRG